MNKISWKDAKEKSMFGCAYNIKFAKYDKNMIFEKKKTFWDPG